MRLLYIGQNVGYVNPSRSLLLRELASRPGVVFSGYGFPEDSSSIKELIRKFGRFDVILAEVWATYKKCSDYLMPHRPIDLLEADTPLIADLIQVDPHTIGAEYLSHLDYFACAISTVAHRQFWLEDFSATLEAERWANDHGPLVSSPHLVDDRFVLMPHCLGSKEYQHLPWSKRRYDVSVLGTDYRFRRDVRAILSNKDIGGNVALGPDFLQRRIGDLGLRNWPFLWMFRWLYGYRFRQEICQSRASITCDGSIGYPIRKFFEIPASGALLGGRFFRNAEALGFVDKDTAIMMEEPDDVLDVLAFLINEPKSAAQIAARGYDMARECHSVERRVDQFLEVAEAVAARRKFRTRWSDGRHVIQECNEKQ